MAAPKGFLVKCQDAKSKFQVVEAEGHAAHKQLPLEFLQAQVGGGYVETCDFKVAPKLHGVKIKWAALCNEDGLSKKMPKNHFGLVGPILLANLVTGKSPDAEDDDESEDFGTWTEAEAQSIADALGAGAPKPPSKK